MKLFWDLYILFLTESSIRIPGVVEEVSKQFREMILKEKDVALAGDAQPATVSNDATSDNGTVLIIFYQFNWFLGPTVSDKSTHPFDVLRKVSIQFEPYVMFVKVCTE